MPRYLLWLAMTFAAMPAWAQSAAEEFEQMLGSFDSLSTHFVQTISADGELIDRQEGQMSLQKPRMIRWETAAPRQLMVCDGDSIYLYDPDLQQVIVRPWRDDPTQNPVSLFTADITLSDWFVIEKIPGGFGLESLQTDALVQRIEVYLDGQGKPAGFRVEDQSGQVSEILFTELELDPDFSASHFSFVPPADADLIVDD